LGSDSGVSVQVSVTHDASEYRAVVVTRSATGEASRIELRDDDCGALVELVVGSVAGSVGSTETRRQRELRRAGLERARYRLRFSTAGLVIGSLLGVTGVGLMAVPCGHVCLPLVGGPLGGVGLVVSIPSSLAVGFHRAQVDPAWARRRGPALRVGGGLTALGGVALGTAGLVMFVRGTNRREWVTGLVLIRVSAAALFAGAVVGMNGIGARWGLKKGLRAWRVTPMMGQAWGLAISRSL
jgi:hypothetical protein